MKKLLLPLLLLLATTGIKAQDAVGYKMPPKEIADLLLAKSTPGVVTDAKADWLLLTDRSSYPSVADMAMPEMRIAGLRINPNNFALSRQAFIDGFTLKDVKTGQSFPVTGLPS